MIFHSSAVSQHVLTTFLKEMKSFYWASPWKDLLRGEECTCLLPFVSFSLASHTTKAVLTNQANNICKEPHTHTQNHRKMPQLSHWPLHRLVTNQTNQPEKKIQNKIIIIITSVITNRRKQRHLFVAHFWYLHSLLNSQNNCSSRCWAACCCLAMGGGKWVGSQSF